MAEKFIVVFKDNVTPDVIDRYAARVEELGGMMIHRYDGTTLNGFAADLTEQCLTSLQGDDLIDYVEPSD
ncbi:hypothetical protein PENARI_c029G02446 [Penicillium arizonense]|uniref:Inhibitor I9 domain-containing protein n=1 Tax=Penicillium arizonense TaxID=1835702 RepID=A0A1F5L5K8_PENAI|nr:hypothetical protein PENARI_c029G02446 [Penicillium arizonense]OGE48377.1 hypothetical protein PENARI_c029G02446 [Penicillium arizonense]